MVSPLSATDSLWCVSSDTTYRMAQTVPLHRLAQIMGHNSLDTTALYSRATAADLQRDVEAIAWT